MKKGDLKYPDRDFLNRKEKHDFRCSVCGKFIGYNEIPDNVHTDFTPDTEYTTEEILFTHKHCYND